VCIFLFSPTLRENLHSDPLKVLQLIKRKQIKNDVRFQFLTAESMKVTAFWDILRVHGTISEETAIFREKEGHGKTEQNSVCSKY
jgi:hypothetical protein